MDASAYLRKQGWRGDGHSLDYTNRGISKPLLVSKKVDVLGVGLNKHKAVSDQWWLRAFDEGLKSFGTGKETALAQVQKHGVNRGGLYANFVKGEKIPGSIGESILPTPEDSTTNTPAELQSDTNVNMAIDVPPEDKLERVVGAHETQHSRDAMMHVLQNPDDAPASMRKMLDRKRKRAERPVEKRARRKTERQEQAKLTSREKRKQAMDEGTWDAEKEEEHKREKEINRKAKEFVLEAQRRGIIPAGPNEIRKGLIPTGANATAVQAMPTDELQKVVDQASLNLEAKPSGKNTKGEKYAREKQKRELKRAAKAYLLGETAEEKKAKKDLKKEQRAEKQIGAAQKQAETMARREERAAKKKELRAQRAAEKAEINRLIQQREAAEKALKTMEGAPANGETTTNGFTSGADEVRFGMNSKGGVKKIPGVGHVDRYPTKAEKKAKKLAAMAIKNGISDDEVKARLAAETAQKAEAERLKIDRYRAMKHGLSLEDYREKLAQGEVQTPRLEKKNIPPEKLAEYKKRAEEKGLKLEEYIRRQEEKFAAKQSEKMGNPFQSDIVGVVEEGGDGYISLDAQMSEAPATNGANAGEEDLGFVVDTTGDDHLDPDRRAIIANGTTSKPLAVIDTAGDATYNSAPNMPIPLDPRIWEGQKPSELPRAVRKARKEWMRQKREEKKARRAGAGEAAPPRKSKGARKVEAREAFVKQILFHSRQYLRSGGQGEPGMVTIEGVENVPLVKLGTKEGMFKKDEVGLARTVARRVLRNVRRAQKAEKGKGKGWKKRERAAKEAARNAGISGPTTQARLREGYKGDLLLLSSHTEMEHIRNFPNRDRRAETETTILAHDSNKLRHQVTCSTFGWHAMETTCRLLALPAEIRSQIYEYVLYVPTASGEVTIRPSKAPSLLAILQTCRQIEDEAKCIFYNINHLRICTRAIADGDMYSYEDPETLRYLTATLDTARAAAVKNLTVRLAGRRPEEFCVSEVINFFPSVTTLHIELIPDEDQTWCIFATYPEEILPRLRSNLSRLTELREVRVTTMSPPKDADEHEQLETELRKAIAPQEV
ncbi:hypothetical protein LTR37_010132 [Vermiconidia calcicola]|uniref:Uncharacterized protein n=1 Tax=Vermiconidia calcicola TaxID=1690605 RepID=A0ACC3N5Z3_9PEZI|nr:hypothetical protein LTR37_010132 [Vermiconidia calcicola]